jgi:hypothetical protein
MIVYILFSWFVRKRVPCLNGYFMIDYDAGKCNNYQERIYYDISSFVWLRFLLCSFWSVQLAKVICPLRSGAAIDYIVGYSDVRDE